MLGTVAGDEGGFGGKATRRRLGGAQSRRGNAASEVGGRRNPERTEDRGC